MFRKKFSSSWSCRGNSLSRHVTFRFLPKPWPAPLARGPQPCYQRVAWKSRVFCVEMNEKAASVAILEGITHENCAPAVTNGRIDDLTCCRALFATWVFTYHLNLQLFDVELFGFAGPFVRRGYLGVDGFFLLSGLLLAHVHPNLGISRGDLRRFWLRRLLRIYPVHIAVIGILVALWLAAGGLGLTPRVPERFGGDELARHILLLHGWGLSDRWAWNYPSWSISTEWAGYLAFPPLWLALRRMPVCWVVALCVALVFALALVELGGKNARLNLTFTGALPRFFCEFLAGMALARILGALPLRIPGHLLIGPSAGLGLGLVALGIASGRDVIAVMGLFFLLAALMVAAHTGRGPWLAWCPGMVFLGNVSYAFYMSFAVVEVVLAVLSRRLALNPADHPAGFAVLATTLTFALALVLWRWVERPTQRRLAPLIG